MPPNTYTRHQLETTTEAYLHEAKETSGDSYDSKESVNKYADHFDEFFETSPGKKVMNQAKNDMPRIRGSWSEKINKVAEDMFRGAEIALERAAEKGSLVGTAKQITKGMLYLLCYVGATLVALILGIIQFVVRVLRAFAKAAWVTISAVTGFVLGSLYTAAKHPATWVALTGAGVAVMVVNPIVGGLMAVIGGILTFITAL